MKVLLASLLVLLALVEGTPIGKRGKQRKSPEEKGRYFGNLKKPSSSERRKPWEGDKKPGMKKPHFPGMMHQVRWCVTNPCELKKCKRMATEFNYMVEPRLQWSCMMKDNKEKCMEEIKRGYADIMTAEGDDIYTAGKMYDLIPIISEKEDYSSIPDYDSEFSTFEDEYGHIKHYSIALVKKTDTNINGFKEMEQRKSCHSGVDNIASFKSPMCSLINKHINSKIGNLYERAGEFFKESCVPGVQHDEYNPNMTNPGSLCKLCKGSQDDEDFCETLSNKEPYYGFTGALKCLREEGDVGFFHTYDVMKNFQALSREFKIVCEKEKLDLEWNNVVKASCHLSVVHPQVLMVSSYKPEHWITLCTKALVNASTIFSSLHSVNAFSLFDSTPYCAKKMGRDVGEDGNMWGMDRKKNKDLIFKDHSCSLETIPKEKRTYKKFLTKDTQNMWKTCEQLEHKPRAFFCVVGKDEMEKCKVMIEKFEIINDIKNISWGCIEAPSKKDCINMISKNMADLVYLNATEMFMAGKDYNLAPIIGENKEGKDPWTESITIGVMLKHSRNLSENMRSWRMCNAGVHKISGFLHPMGWLMANGTIKRLGSPLKSIAHHFEKSCVPGMNTLDLKNQTLLSLTMDWESLLLEKDVHWVEYYKSPLWRKWQDKQNGNSDEYESMHKMQDFDSPQFQMMIQMMKSEHPSVHKYHTPEVHEALEKLKKPFSWNNYKGIKDFCNLQAPKWEMVSWAWQMPEDWIEEEWHMFMMWGEHQWNENENCGQYANHWTDNDWTTFKDWMNTEYKDYNQTRMHQDIFIRFTLLCARLHWLMNQFKLLQWENKDIKYFRGKMCDACVGQGDKKCSMDTLSEGYYGYSGALKCLSEKDGDVAFMDAYTFDDAVTMHGLNKKDLVLMCPNGTKIDIVNMESFKECNFGRVPTHALVTCNMHDGVWRWKVTKALLEAQKVLTPETMFEDSIFGDETKSLTPIPFVNQTYQVWLGPMFLRAMESIMQPPVKDKERHEDEETMEDCEGEECDVVEDYTTCDKCDEEDKMCMEQCQIIIMDPSEDGKFMTSNGFNDKEMNMPPREHKKSMMMMKKGMRKGPMMRYMRKKMHMGAMKHRMMGMRPMGQMKHPRMRPRMTPLMMDHEGPVGKMQRPYLKPGMRPTMMGHMGPMGPIRPRMKPGMKGSMMGHIGPMMGHMGPMMGHMGPMIGHMGPMMGHMGPMMHHKKMGHQHGMMGKMMHRHKMMSPGIEIGPMMYYRRVRGEYYTKVIFLRNGTCNAIVSDLVCYGEPKNIKMQAGRVGKTLIHVPMCPKPTVMKKTTAQFTCNTGVSFLKTFMLPVKCSYEPCNPEFWLPDWAQDNYWDGANSYSEDHWGTKLKDWWSFDKRGDNDNWFLGQAGENRISKKEPRPKINGELKRKI